MHGTRYVHHSQHPDASAQTPESRHETSSFIDTGPCHYGQAQSFRSNDGMSLLSSSVCFASLAFEVNLDSLATWSRACCSLDAFGLWGRNNTVPGAIFGVDPLEVLLMLLCGR